MNYLGGNATDICTSRYLTPLINHEFAIPYLIKPTHPVYTSLRRCFNQIAALYSSKEFGYELALKAFLLHAFFLSFNTVIRILKQLQSSPRIN